MDRECLNERDRMPLLLMLQLLLSSVSEKNICRCATEYGDTWPDRKPCYVIRGGCGSLVDATLGDEAG